MKHAGAAALDRLEPLPRRLRARPELRERTRGVFYLRSRAFLHFHEDPEGFADVRLGRWRRMRVSGAGERAALLEALKRFLARPNGSPG